MEKKSIALAVGLFIIGGLTGAVVERFAVMPGMGSGISLGAAASLLESVTHGEAKAEKVFPGPGGLTGIEVTLQGHPTVAFATADGRYLIAGPVLNKQGEDEAHTAMVKLGLIPKPASAGALAAKAAGADSFVLGTGGPEITAFVDPNCIFCHKFYEEAKPLIDAGKLRVRYVVVAFLKPSSMPKATAILGAADPAAAMAKNEKGFDTVTEEGGIAPAQNPAAATLSAVENNTRLLGESGEMATPTLIYCNSKGEPTLAHGLGKESFTDFAAHIGNLQNGACRK
ncbi:MAG: thiol:disulfide interchange protein DsbG [Acidithiobacillus ferrooxidans]|nr:thiol:disulfide interchange protein DsbG [Acidithiobacillus ferrooxidans]MDD5002568.1 thiol:disulfide interchange protein DsbG [Acidithiobacillus sp.]MDD5377859.1 thiol:disulfide interchange protein DsbG [Acidithiobacillus sp.]MDD5576142.1 thiol:disulfide interchange protein DsbG [Acidithiobacillus sp.]